MKRYVSNLVFTLLALIGVFVIATGYFAANQMNTNQVKTVEKSLARELKMIRADVVWPKNYSLAQLSPSFQMKADEINRSTKLRVTFVYATGEVIADSSKDASTLDNHLSRPEIKKAKASGKIAFADRMSNTLQKTMIYAALPIKADGQLLGFIRISEDTVDIDDSISNLWAFTLLGLIVALLIAAVFAFFMGSKITTPITEINNAAEQIMRMNFNVKTNIDAKDEIGKLGLTINTIAENFNRQMGRVLESERQLSNVMENMTSGVIMLDQNGRFVLLNRSAEEMLGFNFSELKGREIFDSHQQSEFVSMVTTAFERGEAQRDELLFYYPKETMMDVNVIPMFQKNNAWVGMLIVLNDITAIRRLEKMRSEFVANVSHELKTPIAAIKGFSETILSGNVKDKETMDSFLKIIFDESNRLDRLVMDILDLSKIESRRIPLYFSPIQLAPFITELITVMEPQANAKMIALRMDVSDEIYIEADEDRLKQILINLLSNGINYTPNGGKVVVTATEVEDEDGNDFVRICVEDTGLGIPKKDLPRIFERFYRVDKARSRVSGGTGLGLSIVKYLVELHNGSITVQSELGVGSKFILDLPIIHD